MEETSTITMSSPLPNRNSANGVSATNIAEFRQGPTTRLSLSSQDPIRVSTEESVAPSCGLRKTVSILAIAPTRTQLPREATGATVFVGGSGASSVSAVANSTANAPANWTQTSIPEVQTANGYGTRRQDHQKESQQQQLHTVPAVHGTSSHQRQSSQPHHTAQHVVKIRINPELDTSRVVSTIRLNPEPEDSPNSSVNKSHREENGTSVEDHGNPIDGEFWTRREDATRLSVRGLEASSVRAESRVRISVVSGNVTNDQGNEDQREDKRSDDRSANPRIGENQESARHRDEMLQRQRVITNDAINTSLSRSGGSLYFGSFPNSLTTMMTTTSGQCSPSDTLDSGTCSDLDGTPPPLPKKKNSSTVLLGINASNGNSPKIGKVTPGSQQSRHNRAGSVTSSGPELDSDDNESNISCDSLNGAELASRIAEHRSIRVNGVALVEVDDKTEKAPSCDNNSPNGVIETPRVSGTDGNGHRVVGRECSKVNDHDDTCDVKNNNNNDQLSNNNEPEITNGTKVNGDREMNERNNGNVEATDPAILSTELISASSSSSSPTSGPSPSVSPSPSGASSLSKASSTPRVRSPVSNGHSSPVQSSPMIKECTYEERKREQDRINEENAAADYYANYNRKNGTKYLYDDDRFYKFHINENQSDNENDNENEAKIAERESDEFFDGYKILDREAIRSAKGTVRGVKNRVRAGIATFLEKPTTKNYKTMDAGKIVVYVTSMHIVRKTYNSCLTMLKFLGTHMVEYEVRDLFMSRELQTELKERMGCETVNVPQLFIDGQHIGNADAVERLNESGELRDMFKPYKSPNAPTTCQTCGGCLRLPCPICNGSKKSPFRNDFMKEFYWLRCMNCDEVGLVRCQNC